MIAKEKYRLLCQKEHTIPIFSRDWWLDATAGKENWDVALAEKDGQIVASLPYMVRRKYGVVLLTQPKLTQTLGPWIKSNAIKYAKKLAQEKDLMEELINQLPKYHYYSQNWNHTLTNWLPFYWQGFEQTTRYTYRLPSLYDIDVIWKGFRENIRGDIRKARNRFNLTVRTDLSIDDFFLIHVKTFERQKMDLPYTKSFIEKLDKACADNSARAIFIAEDEQGRYHAGVYIVWDEQNAYYLMGGGDPELRTSGATSLCMWEAIQFAATVTKGFDFEGSMIEPVERFFRAFGAIQTPYFAVSRASSRVFRTVQYIRSLLAKN